MKRNTEASKDLVDNKVPALSANIPVYVEGFGRVHNWFLAMLYNFMVNKGMEAIFNKYGATWLEEDFSMIQFSKYECSVLEIINPGHSRRSTCLKLGINPKMMFTHGFCTSHEEHTSTWLRRLLPSYAEQIRILDDIWAAKIVINQIAFETGHPYNVLAEKMTDMVMAMNNFGATVLGTNEAMRLFAEAFKSISVHMQDQEEL